MQPVVSVPKRLLRERTCALLVKIYGTWIVIESMEDLVCACNGVNGRSGMCMDISICRCVHLFHYVSLTQ